MLLLINRLFMHANPHPNSFPKFLRFSDGDSDRFFWKPIPFFPNFWSDRFLENSSIRIQFLYKGVIRDDFESTYSTHFRIYTNLSYGDKTHWYQTRRHSVLDKVSYYTSKVQGSRITDAPVFSTLSLPSKAGIYGPWISAPKK